MENKTMKQQMKPVLLNLSWGRLAKEYFDKSASWFYNKFNGIDGNGKPTEFSPQERQTLKAALYDLAERIKTAADGIE